MKDLVRCISRGHHQIPDDFACLIEIKDLSKQADPLSPRLRFKEYIDTLLHEMLHAYFAIYTCATSPACKESCDTLLHRHGHGNAWQDAALVIENATEVKFEERIDMGREIGLVSDWVAQGRMPAENDIDVTQWGFKYDELKAHFESSRASSI